MYLSKTTTFSAHVITVIYYWPTEVQFLQLNWAELGVQVSLENYFKSFAALN